MSPTTELPSTAPMGTPSAAVTGPRYYRSFATYFIPYRPVDELPYTKTEGFASYYVAYFDAAGRVVQFESIRLQRPMKEFLDIPLLDRAEPGSNIYFAVTRDDKGDPRLENRITYSDTERLTEFYAGTVDDAGASARVSRLEKRLGFIDRYEYWPGDRLRMRLTTGPDGEERREFYDEEGRRVQEPVTPERADGSAEPADLAEQTAPAIAPIRPWRIASSPGALEEAQSLLTPDQWTHVRHWIATLAYSHSVSWRTARVVPVANEHTLRFLPLKGEVFGSIEVQVLFALIPETQTVLILNISIHRGDANIPPSEVVRSQSRLASFLAMTPDEQLAAASSTLHLPAS